MSQGKEKEKKIKIRHMWLIKPLTHIKESNKKYTRKKREKEEDDNDESPDTFRTNGV